MNIFTDSFSKVLKYFAVLLVLVSSVCAAPYFGVKENQVDINGYKSYFIRTTTYNDYFKDLEDTNIEDLGEGFHLIDNAFKNLDYRITSNSLDSADLELAGSNY